MSETPSNDSEFGRLVKIIKDNQGLCPCGHDLGRYHNSMGCYARASYDPLAVCDCDLTDDDDWAAVALASKLVHEGLMYTWVTDEGTGGVDQEDLHPFQLAARNARALELHRPIRVYDECQHPADHGCTPVDVHPFGGCDQSFIGWACACCCFDGVEPVECRDHDGLHEGVDMDHACRTRATLLGVEWDA